jgi:hypothetical protein
MLRAVSSAVSAGTILLVVLSVGALPTAAANPSDTTFVWVASADQGDGHSWSDPRNWEPHGVPGDGDSVSMAALPGITCTSDIDGVPSALQLQDLEVVSFSRCHLELHDGAITVSRSLNWAGAVLDAPVTLGPLAAGTVVGNGEVGTPTLNGNLDLQGSLEVLGLLDVGPGVQVSVSGGGDLQIDPGATIEAAQSDGAPSVLTVRGDGAISVPPDPEHSFGPATVSGLAVQDEQGTTTIATGSVLRIVDGPRGRLGRATISGGGTLLLANPTDSIGTTSLVDGSRLVLLPGSTFDGGSRVRGDGSLIWRGGRISSRFLTIAVRGFTVAGPGTKEIGRINGAVSDIEVLSRLTFAGGTDDQHNTLDLNGNAFDLNGPPILLQDHAEIAGGILHANSASPVTIDPGPHGTVFTKRDGGLEVTGQVDVASGTLISRGQFGVVQQTGEFDVEEGARLVLPVLEHPLGINVGTLTGQGTIVGPVLNFGGTVLPYQGGSPIPLRIEGTYTQAPDGHLVLDLSADTEPLRIGDAVVQGDVTYRDARGFLPRQGDTRSMVVTSRSLVWAPDCEQTKGSGSSAGHWVSSHTINTLTAIFTAGEGDRC